MQHRDMTLSAESGYPSFSLHEDAPMQRLSPLRQPNVSRNSRSLLAVLLAVLSCATIFYGYWFSHWRA